MKRIGSLLLALALVFVLVPVSPVRAEPVRPTESDNSAAQEYDRWSAPVRSCLIPTESGFQRIEAPRDRTGYGDAGHIVVEDYSGDLMQCVRSRSIALELPIFGGVFCGEAWNFVICGRENPDEDDNLEVIRVIRYDRDWNRLDHVSIRGINTTIPFDAGSLRCAESGSRLFIRTCHEMYQSQDGLHHQANLQILIDSESMTLLDTFHRVWNIESGYVSHSFNQFGIVDGTDYITADHGDAYPRSVVLCRYRNADSMTRLPDTVEYVEVLPIQGQLGDNTTGVTVGGLQTSDTACLVAGTSVRQEPGVDQQYAVRNLFVTVTPRSDFRREATTVRWLTDYAKDASSASTPHLVRLSADRFLLLWTTARDRLHYRFLDGSGEPVSREYEDSGLLSDCVPICRDGRVIWYYTQNSEPVFLRIDPAHPETVERICCHEHEWSEWEMNPDDLSQEIRTCRICGAVETRPHEHIWSDWQTAVRDGRDLKERRCGKCGQTETVDLGPHVHSWSEWELDPDDPGRERRICSVCAETEFRPVNPFRDVQRSDYFYESVLWAVEHGVTSGVAPDRFGPDETCTRGQIMTFLWNAMGRPQPEHPDNPFSDLPAGEYYYTPVLWAVGAGVTSGVAPDRFGPDEDCTRGQIMTFLWNAMGRPQPEHPDNPFSDLPAGEYYYTPVLWAVERGITSGMGNGCFGPDETCTRAQAVTFLRQAFGD